MKYIEKILSIFDNYSKGWSIRKVAAFASIAIAAVVTFKFTQPIYLVEVLMVWLTFAGTCLGLVHWENIQKLKIKTQNEKTTDSVPGNDPVTGL